MRNYNLGKMEIFGTFFLEKWKFLPFFSWKSGKIKIVFIFICLLSIKQAIA